MSKPNTKPKKKVQIKTGNLFETDEIVNYPYSKTINEYFQYHNITDPKNKFELFGELGKTGLAAEDKAKIAKEIYESLSEEEAPKRGSKSASAYAEVMENKIRVERENLENKFKDDDNDESYLQARKGAKAWKSFLKKMSQQANTTIMSTSLNSNPDETDDEATEGKSSLSPEQRSMIQFFEEVRQKGIQNSGDFEEKFEKYYKIPYDQMAKYAIGREIQPPTNYTDSSINQYFMDIKTSYDAEIQNLGNISLNDTTGLNQAQNTTFIKELQEIDDILQNATAEELKEIEENLPDILYEAEPSNFSIMPLTTSNVNKFLGKKRDDDDDDDVKTDYQTALTSGTQLIKSIAPKAKIDKIEEKYNIDDVDRLTDTQLELLLKRIEKLSKSEKKKLGMDEDYTPYWDLKLEDKNEKFLRKLEEEVFEDEYRKYRDIIKPSFKPDETLRVIQPPPKSKKGVVSLKNRYKMPEMKLTKPKKQQKSKPIRLEQPSKPKKMTIDILKPVKMEIAKKSKK